ncbi:MAG: sulfotransferase [Alphaproteobacteria bacterium]|nr:sulfotransferase [Alphaproteobacteria bacterium]
MDRASISAPQLIVSGTYRSGTTLVQKRLDAHRSCAVVMQPAVPFFRMLRECLHRAGAPVSDPTGPMGIAFPNEPTALSGMLRRLVIGGAEVHRAISDTATLARSQAERGDRDGLQPRMVDALRTHLRPGTAMEVIEGFFAALRAYRGAAAGTCIGFKDVYIQEIIDGMLGADDPDLRVILVLRDPRAVLASRNFGAFRGAIDGPNQHPLLLVARMWTSAARWQRALLQRYPGRVHALSYEQLVTQRQATMDALWRFIGVNPDDAGGDETLRCESGRPWTRNSSYSESGDVTRSDWRAVLPRETIGALEFLCGDDMIRHGYEPTMNLDERRKGFSAFAESEDRLVPWTRLPDFILNERTRQRELAARVSASAA